MRPLFTLLLALTCAAEPTPGTRNSALGTPGYDVRIINGDVIDGTGRARFRADVGIRGDKIAAIGDLSHATATTTIDARNQVVTPGFIDLLGHSESSVLIDPNLEGKVRQGVTTELTGEGHSPGPLSEAMAAEMERTKPPGWPPVSWRTLGEFMKVIEKRGSAINFAFFIGAANPREIVIGTVNRAPTVDELKRMEAIVDQAMREGAIGMSTALIYPPGNFATTEELIALAKHSSSYWTHLRSESSGEMPAFDEAFRIGREAHVPINTFHIKAGGPMRGHMPEIIAKIEAAQKSGLDIKSNIYPYTATATDLTSIVPSWALEGGYLQFVARLKDPAIRARVAQAMRVGDGSTIMLRQIPSPTLKQFERERLNQIAAEMHTNPPEAALRLFEGSVSSPIGIYFGLSEEDMQYALKQPWVSVGSDSGAVVGVMREAGAHPRAYGTFPRVAGHYVRDVHLFTLEEAVRKMTSQAASRAGFKDRGVIRVGAQGDVIVFNPATIRDTSTYEDPHHFAVGISNVIVNGALVLHDNKMTGALPGRMLRANRR